MEDLLGREVIDISADESLGYVSNKVVFMDGGVIVEESSPKELFTNPKNDRTKEFLSRFINN